MTDKPVPVAPPSSFAGRAWGFIRIVNVRLRFIYLMVLVGLTSAYWEDLMNYYDRWRRPQPVAAAAAETAEEYYCPMHPNIVRSSPGKCPICGMPLSKRQRGQVKELPSGVLAEVQLTPYKVRMGRIGTSPVEYRLLTRELRTVGSVDYDETRRAFISARVKGRVEKLFVDFTGQHVQAGDPLVALYSPDLLVAQEELLSVSRAATGGEGLRTLTEAARRKLLLWGITESQIDEILQRGRPETYLSIKSPIAGIVTDKKVLEGQYVNEGDDLYTVADLSRVWVQAKIFEAGMSDAALGAAVEVTSVAYPNEIFVGKITFVAYNLDPATRTVNARIEVENPDFKLRPGMYTEVTIRTPAGAVEPLEAGASQPAAPQPTAASAALARAYLAVAGAFAQDRSDAAAIGELAKQARQLGQGADAAAREPAAALAGLVDKLAGQGFKAQRTAFQEVSRATIEFLKAHPPAGITLYIVHCPMVKADWLSEKPEVRNPYYGSGMLECGSVTGPLKPTGTADERFVTGYYCPLHPDQLRSEPGACPIDRMPLPYVKIARSLAVPESAVINTGKRYVVYREAGPGVFEMVEVQLGPRAGDFYPLVSGLEPGTSVVTRGAFVVDAENRLNPAASAQYFGASGGPQDSGHNH